MKIKEVISGYRLIVRFMEYKIGNGGTKANPVYTNIIISPSGVTWATDLRSLMLEQSWDRLVPVVKKMREIITSPKENASIVLRRMYHDTIVQLSKLEIENVFKSCIKFIQFYDQQI